MNGRLASTCRNDSDPENFNIASLHIRGDTENTVAEGTHDWCIEVVYRGDNSPDSATSRTGLKVVEIVRFSDISLIGRRIPNPWAEEFRRITAVAQAPTGSSTSKLLGDKNEICKKVGEESAEFVRAFAEEVESQKSSTMLCML